LSELQKENEKGQRTNIKSSIFALLVELVSKVAKHGCRNQRESVDHGHNQQAGNSLIVEKKLTLRIKFVFGSFPARNETFWCFFLQVFPPSLIFFLGITNQIGNSIFFFRDNEWRGKRLLLENLEFGSIRSDKIRELKRESKVEIEIEIELKPNFYFPPILFKWNKRKVLSSF